MTTQDYRPHAGPCCSCTPSLRGSIQGAIVSIDVLKEMERDAEAMAAAEHAENLTLRAALKLRATDIRRLRAALQTSNDKLAAVLEINARQAQHIRSLHAEGVKS